ncbi:Uncharacterised protein [Enterobacter cloacae]|nr:Uncharacterised protein [Enterobacter cloacae]
MFLDPAVDLYRFVFEGQQHIHSFLCRAGFDVAGDQLPFTVLFDQVLPFPAAFEVFQLLIFHCDLSVTV